MKLDGADSDWKIQWTGWQNEYDAYWADGSEDYFKIINSDATMFDDVNLWEYFVRDNLVSINGRILENKSSQYSKQDFIEYVLRN